MLSDFSTAIGLNSVVDDDASRAVVVGESASVTGNNAIAIGQNVSSTQVGQVVIGGGNNTYQLGGVATDASRSRQEGPLQVLTTDINGNFAEDNGAFQSRVDGLRDDVDQNTADVALAMAVESHDMVSNENFAMALGFGTFEGESAVGGKAKVQLSW